MNQDKGKHPKYHTMPFQGYAADAMEAAHDASKRVNEFCFCSNEETCDPVASIPIRIVSTSSNLVREKDQWTCIIFMTFELAGMVDESDDDDDDDFVFMDDL